MYKKDNIYNSSSNNNNNNNNKKNNNSNNITITATATTAATTTAAFRKRPFAHKLSWATTTKRRVSKNNTETDNHNTTNSQRA